MPDLACIDWNMPVMDGLQFVSAVRADPAWRSMTIMMVTTESEHGQIVRALAAGAHEYVIKPFTADAIGDKLALLGPAPRRGAGMSAARSPTCWTARRSPRSPARCGARWSAGRSTSSPGTAPTAPPWSGPAPGWA